MALTTTMTEHAGAKNGGGMWATRLEAKTASKVGRRRLGRSLIEEGLSEIAEDEAELDEAARVQALKDEVTLKAEDVTEGDFYEVVETEPWGPNRMICRTPSLAKALAKFNEAVCNKETSYSDVALGIFHLVNDEYVRLSEPVMRETVFSWRRGQKSW